MGRLSDRPAGMIGLDRRPSNGLFSLREYPCRTLQKKWQVRIDHLLAFSDERSTRSRVHTFAQFRASREGSTMCKTRRRRQQ
jgi:hypothetical protein